MEEDKSPEAKLQEALAALAAMTKERDQLLLQHIELQVVVLRYQHAEVSARLSGK